MSGVGPPIELFTTCPQSRDGAPETYTQKLVDAARWSDRAGCRGMLVYSDNGLVDPWLVSQVILQNTEHLCPLVAVQPVYMHPYSVAKMVASLAYLHNRRIFLNMLAGGFKNDLVALGDATPHDERYDRTVEFTLLVKELLSGSGPVALEGRYYRVQNLRLTPPVAQALLPGILMSGSSDAGRAAAVRVGATVVKYPAPPEEEAEATEKDGTSGIRVGIIARPDGAEAWRVAHERFPEDRRGQITHAVAMKVSDSAWHKQLSAREGSGDSEDNPYWLGPFHNYKSFCPYLVGSYDRVAAQLARYVTKGFRTFILDIPASQEELEHTTAVFAKAIGGRA